MPSLHGSSHATPTPNPAPRRCWSRETRDSPRDERRAQTEETGRPRVREETGPRAAEQRRRFEEERECHFVQHISHQLEKTSNTDSHFVDLREWISELGLQIFFAETNRNKHGINTSEGRFFTEIHCSITRFTGNTQRGEQGCRKSGR